MSVSYAYALDILREVAERASVGFQDESELVLTNDAVGRISQHAVVSPASTPASDNSAMDGYALDSTITQNASEATPLLFQVVGFLAAGDKALRKPETTCEVCDPLGDRLPACIEVATGARFPAAPFDACVRIEASTTVLDTSLLLKHRCPYQYIQITKPVTRNQHKRLAGEDFVQGQTILYGGETIQPQHVMALASVGIGKLKVYPRLHIGVVSTGSELVQFDRHVDHVEDFHVRNSNAPYLSAAMTQLGVHVDFLGLVKDDVDEFRSLLCSVLRKSHYHVIITTGAVSVGRFDFVRQGLEQLGAGVEFHNVSVRPGHPILFATLPQVTIDVSSNVGKPVIADAHTNGTKTERSSITSFFGLPGNPIATVACFRFFVVPYLRFFHGEPLEVPERVQLTPSNPDQSCETTSPQLPHLDQFRLAKRKQGSGQKEVKLIAKQSSSLVRPFLDADCWVIIPRRNATQQLETKFECLPLHPLSLRQ